MPTKTITVQAGEIQKGDLLTGREVRSAEPSITYFDRSTGTTLVCVRFEDDHDPYCIYLTGHHSLPVEREAPPDPAGTVRRNNATGTVLKKHTDGEWYMTGQEYSYSTYAVEREGYDVIWSPEGDR